MKHTKTHSGKLHLSKAKGTKLQGRNKMRTDYEDDIPDFDDGEDGEEMAPPTRDKPRPKGAGPRFSPAEDNFIVKQAMLEDGITTIEYLDVIARRCNVKFHGQETVRSGDALWWHIHRDQKRGNPVFEAITIQGGSPKRTQGTQSRKPETAPRSHHAKPKGMIDSALQQKQGRSHHAANKNTGKGMIIDVIIRNPTTGETERLQTTKFISVEDLMFTLT